MSSTYIEFIEKVRAWSNRDAEALPNTVIADALRYAADSAYRDLMIPPLEHTTHYVLRTSASAAITNQAALDNKGFRRAELDFTPPPFTTYGLPTATLPIPGDLVEYVQIRVLGELQFDTNDDGEITNTASTDSNGNPIVISPNATSRGLVFNEKTDIRTFYDVSAVKTRDNYWTRDRNNTILSGFMTQNLVIELHYRRRLPALDARYIRSNIVGLTNSSDPRLTTVVPQRINPISGSFETDPNVANIQIEGATYYAALIPNWLRDENEKVILFGALFQCFDYLNDMEESQKYAQKYAQSVAELNREEQNRTASGGNVQVNYTSYLI